MSSMIVLTDEDHAEVRRILSVHLPPHVSVGVFGSRAGGAPKPWSDLDLVLEGPEPLPLPILAKIAEAFEESALLDLG